jgi:hypothetical protein
MPLGFMIAKDEVSGRKKIVKDPETSDILEDVLKHYMTFQSKRKTLIYLHTKYHISMRFDSLSTLLSNTMLYGAYRDNPSYCEAYMNKEQFDKMQEIVKRNIKDNTTENRVYLFSGLILCPECGNLLKGGAHCYYLKDGTMKKSKKYRCQKQRVNGSCKFNKVVSEKRLGKLMLANIEKYFDEAKIRNVKVTESDTTKVFEYNVDDINAEIDRLNYSWQTGKIRKVEQYEKQYEELMKKLEKAETERGKVEVKDFSKIEAILHDGWKTIYNSLDETHKRSFWRSFVKSIEINWTTEKKEIIKVNFF